MNRDESEIREKFMAIVYEWLSEDGTNSRANHIIGAFDDATAELTAALAAMTAERTSAELQSARKRAGEMDDEIAALRAENERLKDRWEETASDNTGYRLTHFDGIYALDGPEGAVICEFIHDTARAALGKEGH